MVSKWRVTRWMAAVAVLALVLGCVSQEELNKNKSSLTWEDVARSIDYQLGMTSDGSALTCNGQGAALGPGAHCKDQLKGTVTQSKVVQYVEVWNDSVLFGGPTPFYYQGFMPQTNDPCVEDLSPANGTPDYLDACTTGSATCDIVQGHVELDYDNCVWQEPGPDQWLLNGQKDLYVNVSSAGEELLIIRAKGFTATNNSTNATYQFDGDATRYFWLNPFTGTPALGTTGPFIDGMEIVNAVLTVDMDGPGPDASATYGLNFADDYEDGYFFYSLPGPGVWLSNPGGGTLVFYEAGRPWDLTGTGCLVDIQNLDTVNRTFDISSQGPYGDNGCVPDAVGVHY